MRRKTVQVSAIAAAIASVCSAGAIAQSSDVALDRVEVTARKRSEPLQDVPIAAKTYSAEALADEAINSNRDLFSRSASASTVELGAPFASEIILRGSGSGRGINAETTTGLYRNGAYAAGGNIGGRAFNRLDFFDVQRIEILRGPQAALLGRGAVGGAVNIINFKPQSTASRSIVLSTGEYDRVGIEAIVNQPISDALAIRVGAISDEVKGGVFTDRKTGNVLDNERFNGARVSAALTGGNFKYNLLVDGSDASGPSFGTYGFVLAKAAADPANRFKHDFNTPSRAKYREGTVVGEGTWDLGGPSLVFLTQYKRRSGDTSDDLDEYANLSALPTLNSWVRLSDDSFRRVGQEIRVQSADGERLTWLAGVEFLKLKDSFTTNVNGATGAQRPLNSLFTTVSNDTSVGVFGAIGYEITPQWSISGEFRQQSDHKRFTLDTITYTFPTGTPAALQATGPVTSTRLVQDYDRTFTGLAKVFSLTYKATPRLTGYVRYGQAFRPGGFNPDPDRNTAVSTPPGPRFDIPYDQENAKTIELGAKSEWLSRALHVNVAAYHESIDSVLITNNINTTPPGSASSRIVTFLQNAGDARIKGIEIDAQLDLPAPGPAGKFIVDLAASYTDPKMTSGPLSGTYIPQTRPKSGTLGITYQCRPFGLARAFVNINTQQMNGGYQRLGDVQRMDSVSLVNLNMGLRGGNWSASLNVANVTNQLFVTNYNDLAGATGYTNQPRQWSLKGGYTF
jgi:iron complex outermembrane receptor protein